MMRTAGERVRLKPDTTDAATDECGIYRYAVMQKRATPRTSSFRHSRVRSSSPARPRDDITDRIHYKFRFVERNVMTAALGDDVLTDT